MPWTPRQFRFLMSKGSPLSGAQKEKDKAEAHANPAMVHMRKGESRMAAHFRRANR
jgi:hypothetical protein